MLDSPVLSVLTPCSWFGLAAALLFTWQYYKALPFVYHLRVLLIAVDRLFLNTRCFKSVDEEVLLHDRVLLGDMDFNMHMNNAMYNNSLDFCRFSILMRMTKSPFSLLKRVKFANGGVTMFFLRELRAFQKYRIRSKIAAVDNKWLYIAHFFESKNGKVLNAIGVSKMVAKQKNGKTIPPQELFASCGLQVPEGFAMDTSSTGESLQNVLDMMQTCSGHKPVAPTPVAETPKTK